MIMKKTIILTIILSFALFSCNNNEDDFNVIQKSNIEALTQSYAKDFHLNGEDLIIDTIRKSDFKAKFPLTRAITTSHDGIAQGTPKLYLRNQKVIITNVFGVATAPYIADIYKTSGTIELPDGVKDLYFDIPKVCGYVDWATREEGVMKSSPQKKKTKPGEKKKITWYFYTIVLRYDMAGRQMWKVIPEDGAKILLPYTFLR